MVGVTDGALCLGCHSAENNVKGYQAAKEMRQQIELFKGEIIEAERVLTAAVDAGMELSEVMYQFQEARNLLVRARNEIHAFSPKRVKELAEEGLKVARTGQEAGEAALREVAPRQRAMFIPLAVGAFVISLLYLKIREITGRRLP